eukprot:TRINITY_DN32922_c0_g1_i1.p1 TRINITY_DN32922_c0_g1~~TRINITY_DN32922_c0_g1_i1.p1  ORF type:complete len:246 (-),score=38.64 TRINITY_DN32922_c0_g1_i1:61-768(-)
MRILDSTADVLRSQLWSFLHTTGSERCWADDLMNAREDAEDAVRLALDSIFGVALLGGLMLLLFGRQILKPGVLMACMGLAAYYVFFLLKIYVAPQSCYMPICMAALSGILALLLVLIMFDSVLVLLGVLIGVLCGWLVAKPFHDLTPTQRMVITACSGGALALYLAVCEAHMMVVISLLLGSAAMMFGADGLIDMRGFEDPFTVKMWVHISICFLAFFGLVVQCNARPNLGGGK